MFRALKQDIGGLQYHFWTKAMDKLNHFKKRDEPDPLSTVTDEKLQHRIIQTVEAIERFVMFSCICTGLVQLIALDPKLSQGIAQCRYLRTGSSDNISEATVLEYLRKNFFRLLLRAPRSPITQIIRWAQKHDSEQDFAA